MHSARLGLPDYGTTGTTGPWGRWTVDSQQSTVDSGPWTVDGVPSAECRMRNAELRPRRLEIEGPLRPSCYGRRSSRSSIDSCGLAAEMGGGRRSEVGD